MNEVKKFRKKDRTGNHIFRIDGNRVKTSPGQIVECTEKDLGNQLKHYECLSEPTATTETPDNEKIPVKGLKLVRVSRGLYNVINPDNPDKPLNEEPLRKALAESFTLEYQETEIKLLDWDGLVALMDDRGIEVKAEYETEDDLRKALINASE